MDEEKMFRFEWLIGSVAPSGRRSGKSAAGMAMAEKISQISGISPSMMIADELPLTNTTVTEKRIQVDGDIAGWEDKLNKAFGYVSQKMAEENFQQLASSFYTLGSSTQETTMSVERLSQALRDMPFDYEERSGLNDMIKNVAFPDPAEKLRRSIRDEENRRYEEAQQEQLRLAQQEKNQTAEALSELPTFGMF